LRNSIAKKSTVSNQKDKEDLSYRDRNNIQEIEITSSINIAEKDNTTFLNNNDEDKKVNYLHELKNNYNLKNFYTNENENYSNNLKLKYQRNYNYNNLFPDQDSSNNCSQNKQSIIFITSFLIN
jgi:hypothetical protein